MSQTGFTPISIYYSTTASAVPTAGNLVAGELAINTADGKLFYKDSSGVVQVIAGKGGAGVAGGSNTQVQYNSSGSLAGSSNMTFNGTSLTLANDASISGLTVGKGGGSSVYSTVFGNGALAVNTSTVGYNSAFGYLSLAANTSGNANAGFGGQALQANTTGSANSAFGSVYSGAAGAALQANTTGSYNIAVGTGALASNTTASNNTAVGYQAGYNNSTGTGNTFLGYGSGNGMTTGSYNTFVGLNAASAITTGNFNTVIGNYSGNQGGLDIRTASNYIVLSDGAGNPRGWFDASGFFFNPAAYANTTGNAANLYVTSTGYFLRSTSALKYKQDIRDLESININKFRPVRYKSKSEQDDQTKDHFGVIADEVHEAGITELVTYGADGEVEGFQYERLTVVLLKAIQELKAEIDSLKQQLASK